MLVGGGTGGHITPNLAVAHELKRLRPDCTITYVLEKRAKFAHLLADQVDIDDVAFISAGKFRRYHGQGLWAHLVDVKTNLLNIRDAFRTVVGLFEAMRLLRQERPDIILIKGGFVGVPIGFAASRLKIPFVTHDSDSIPGLANRLVARWADYHATGMPAEFYAYPPDKTMFVGVPLAAQYQLVSSEDQTAFRKELNLPVKGKIMLIAGGSSGAERVNQGVARIVPRLLEKYQDLTIVHQIGRGQLKTYDEPYPERLIVAEFFAPEEMYKYSGAADVIVTRGGATNIAEFAAQAKACIVVPNPMLTGGHQLKNAEHLADQGAVEVVTEEELLDDTLFDKVSRLLDSPRACQELAHRLGGLARPKAASDTALLLLEVRKRH